MYYIYTSKLDLSSGYRLRVSQTDGAGTTYDHWFNVGATGGLFAKLTGTIRVGYQFREEPTGEDFGQGSEKWSLRSTVDKNHIMKKYGADTMPMQLRMLAETVYGQGPGGQDGTAMRQMMMGIESGQLGGTASLLNVQNLFDK